MKKIELSPSVSIIIAGIIVAAAVVFSSQNRAAAPTVAAGAGAGQAAAATISIHPPTATDHIIGSASAPIVLVEYSDFQCPYCSMIYPTLKKIVADSNGQIAWIYREMPLTSIHPQAAPAANAAECIAAQLGSAGFWKYADAVFANQQKLSPEYSAQLAASFGADPAKYATCVTNKTYQSIIDTDSAEAQASGGSGTPFTVVVNTKTGKMAPVSGALPEAQILSVINSVK